MLYTDFLAQIEEGLSKRNFRIRFKKGSYDDKQFLTPQICIDFQTIFCIIFDIIRHKKLDPSNAARRIAWKPKVNSKTQNLKSKIKLILSRVVGLHQGKLGRP